MAEGYFLGNDPNINEQLRQRIALQMMAAKKAYPKNIGEGLSSIGDSIGDAMSMKQMLAADAAARANAGPIPGAPLPAGVAAAPTQTSDAAPVISPAIAAANASLPPDAPVDTPAAAPTPMPMPAPMASSSSPVPFAGRNAIAAQLMPPTAQAVPPVNPMQPGPDAAPSSPAPGGQPPDQRVAQAAGPVASDITQAPPLPSGIRQAPPPASDYVMPEPVPPKPPAQVVMPQQYWDAVRERNSTGNPYRAQNLDAGIKQMEAAAALEAQNRREVYQKQLEGHNTAVTAYRDWQAGAAKRNLDLQKLQQEVRTGNIPKLEDIEGKFERDPNTGVWSAPQRAVPVDPNAMPSAKMTEAQQKSLMYHGWASIAQDQLKGKEDLMAHGMEQEALGKVPFAGNMLQSNQYRQAKAASNAFVQAFLRATSGANYGATELQQHLDTLMPKVGDDPQTLRNKAAQRDNFIATQYGGLGPDARAVADYNMKKYREGTAATQGKINEEMAGVVPKGVGDTKVNRKTGAKRVWDGSNWTEAQ